MTLTELNAKLNKFVALNIKQGGVADTAENRAYLAAQAQTEWLLERGWRREQPQFWSHSQHPDFFIVTDTRQLDLMTWQEDTEELVSTETFPHPVCD